MEYEAVADNDSCMHGVEKIISGVYTGNKCKECEDMFKELGPLPEGLRVGDKFDPELFKSYDFRSDHNE